MHIELKEEKKNLYTFIILIAILISGFSIDVYVPSLPFVAHYFNVDKSLVQLTITTYMIGFGLAQLIAGSLSDSLGRKYTLLTSLIIFSFFSFLIPFSINIYQLQLLRFFQGISVAFINVPSRAIISDLYEGKDFYKMMNYVTIAWSIGPIIAPALGGYLQHYFNWHAAFYFLTCYGGVVSLLNILFLPETIKNKRKLKSKELLYWYVHLLLDRNFILGLICLGSIYSMLILFSIVMPFLIQTILHYSPIQFGHMALLVGFAWFLGNITNRFLIHVNIAKKVKILLFLMLVSTVVMLALNLYEPIKISNILIPISFIFYFGGIIFPNYFAQTIALFQHIAGYANGLMGACIVLIAGLGSALGIILKSHSPIPLTLAYLAIIVICLLCNQFMTQKELVTSSTMFHE